MYTANVLEMGYEIILEHLLWGIPEIDAPRCLKILPKWKLWAPKKDPNEAKMEPGRTKNEPKVDNSGAKGEVLDHM